MRYITNLAAASRDGFFLVIIYVQVFLDRSTRFDFCPTLNVGQKSILKVGRSVQTVSTRSNIFLEQRKSPMEVGERLDPIQLDSTSIRQAFDLLQRFPSTKLQTCSNGSNIRRTNEIMSNERSGKSRNLIKEALSCTKSAEAVTDYGAIYSRFAVGIHVGWNFSLVTAET